MNAAGASNQFESSIKHAHHAIVSFIKPGEHGIGEPFGTGFFINTDGYLVTNAHVIRAAQKYNEQGIQTALYYLTFLKDPERISGMNVADYEIIEISDRFDVAVLRATSLKKSPEFLTLSITSVPVGRELAFTGFPLGREMPVTISCRAASPTMFTLPFPDDQSGYAFLLDKPVIRGHSGSPIYLQQSGVVVGIASGSLNAPLETIQGPASQAGYGALGVARTLQYLEEILIRRKIPYKKEAPIPGVWPLPKYKSPQNNRE